jgi:hypothetical protein
MIGAGAASEYCFLCGLPFNRPLNRGLAVDEDDILNLEWLEYGIGFDPHRRVSCVVQSDDGYGRFQIEGTQKWFCREDRSSPQCEYTGQVCHMACAEFVETTIGHRIDVDTMMRLYRQSNGVQSRDYHSQFYRWDDAIMAEDYDFFSSPTSDEGYSVQRRILKCLAAADMLGARGQSGTAAVRPQPKPSKQSSKPSSETQALSLKKKPSGSSATVDATTYEYEDLLAACDHSTMTLVELARHQRRSKDVAELSAVALAVGTNLVRLSRACADSNRGSPTTGNLGVKIGSPSDSTTRRCGRFKKAVCTKSPDCKWKTGVGCINNRP